MELLGPAFFCVQAAEKQHEIAAEFGGVDRSEVFAGTKGAEIGIRLTIRARLGVTEFQTMIGEAASVPVKFLMT